MGIWSKFTTICSDFNEHCPLSFTETSIRFLPPPKMTVRCIVRYARSGLLRAMPESLRGQGDCQGTQGAYFLAPRAGAHVRTRDIHDAPRSN